MNFDASQLAAIEATCDPAHRNRVITGGAGTGKTTLIQAIAERIGPCEIMAPTGKAAARLKEATGFDACTIHRALMFDGEKLNRSGKINRPVIVDESSMIDSWLLAQLLKFDPPKLILVGDSAQLAPVGKGQPFHDLIRLRPDITSELTHCWRAQGAVHKAAQSVRRGDPPYHAEDSGGETFRMIDTGEAESTTERIVAWVKAGQFDVKTDVILSPRYGDSESNDAGIHSINKAVRALLNPSDRKFATGDRCIINKNFGSDDLWNGDLGFISDIDQDEGLWLTLDRDRENPRLVKKDQVKEVAHAYCLSVHKSQGSQFRRVFFVCLKRHWHQLSRSLIYTAITRAQKGVVVLGELGAFYHGINVNVQKKTVIQYLAAQRATV